MPQKSHESPVEEHLSKIYSDITVAMFSEACSHLPHAQDAKGTEMSAEATNGYGYVPKSSL